MYLLLHPSLKVVAFHRKVMPCQCVLKAVISRLRNNALVKPINQKKII